MELQLTKEEFCKQIEEVKKCVDFEEKVYELSKQVGDCFECTLLTAALADNVIDLLSIIMNDLDDDISFFCWDLDFGRKWEKGDMVDVDGNDIELSSAEKLYDYLISVME